MLVLSQDIHLLVVHPYMFWTLFIMPFHRAHTQVNFLNYDQLWWHYRNGLPSAVVSSQILHQWDHFYCINVEHIVVLWNFSPDESILYVLCIEVCFNFTIFCLPILTDAAFSSPSWLYWSSTNAQEYFSSNNVTIMIADVTDVSLLPNKVRFVIYFFGFI